MLCAGFDISKTDQPQAVGEIFSFTMMPENLFVHFNRREAREGEKVRLG